MDRESLVLKTRENPDQTLLWEAASVLLRLGWEWVVLGVMCHCFSWVPGLHWKRPSWGHWSWWGDSAVPRGHLWQSIITAFLVPGLPCECSWGHRAKSWVTSASQVTLTPGIPKSVSFLGLYDTIPFFPALPQSVWPALIRLISLLSLIAQCVGFLRAPLQLLLFFLNNTVGFVNYESNNVVQRFWKTGGGKI